MENHVSIRKYKKQDVSPEIIERVLQKSIRASSSGNMQTYSIITVSDEKIRRELYPHLHSQSMVLDAPVFMVFCADTHRMEQWEKIYGVYDGNFDNLMSFMVGAIDAILVSQNAVLGFEEEGLGICYLGSTLAFSDSVSKVLKLPKKVVPVVGFTLGYPDESPALRDRLPLKYLHHQNGYTSYSDEELLKCYAEKEDKNMKRYMAIPELKKIIEEKDIKTLAQYYVQAKYTKEDCEKYSANVMRCLKEQGFIKD